MQATQEKPWWYAPLTIGALQCESEGDSLAVVDRWTGMGYNTEQLLHCIGEGFYACYQPALHNERLQRYLERARSKGLRVILYLNTHMLPVTWEEQHPDFFARNREGTLRQAYNKHFAFVDAASSWRDFVMQSAREAVALGVDGIFSDGPVETDSWSDGAARFYREQTGQNLDDLPDTATRPAVKRRIDRLIADTFVRDLSQAIKEINRNCLFYTNLSIHTSPVHTLASQDMIGSEGGFSYYGRPRESKHWKAGFTARVLEGWAQEKPRVNFISADFKPWHRVLKPGADLVRQAANAAQHGSNYWIGWHSPAADLDGQEAHALVRLNQVITSNPTVFSPTRSLAEVACYWSFDSLALDSGGEASDFYARGESRGELLVGHYAETMGWCRALITSHIPFDVLSSGFTTPDDLTRYHTLILPAVSALSPDEVSLLSDWVSAGGRLIVSADPGRLAPDGSLLEQASLASLLGMAQVGAIVERGTCNFMTATAMEPVGGKIKSGDLMPSYTRMLKVTAGNAQSLIQFNEPVEGQYNPLSPLAGDAALWRAVGRGEAIFFAGNIGDSYGEFGLPALRQLMERVVTHRQPQRVQFENLPGFAEVSVRQSIDARQIIVHLVNHGGDFEQPTETPVTLHNVVVMLKLESRPRSVRALMADTELEFVWDGSSACVTVPPFQVFESVVFEI